MTWTLKLDEFEHDLRIRNGRFDRVRGSDEVRQRMKVNIWYYLGEYFLNTPDGTPWYESILGRKTDGGVVSNILRTRILRTPGALRITDLAVQYNNELRRYDAAVNADVQSGPGEASSVVNTTLTVSPGGSSG